MFKKQKSNLKIGINIKNFNHFFVSFIFIKTKKNIKLTQKKLLLLKQLQCVNKKIICFIQLNLNYLFYIYYK